VLDVLAGFVQELRSAGLPVSLTEAIDAAAALREVPLEDRQAVKYALGATLVKSSAHWRAFETAFEVYFSLRGPQYAIERPAVPPRGDAGRPPPGLDGGRGAASGGGEALSGEELAALLLQALRSGDDALLAAVARLAVLRYAGMEPGRPVGGTYYLYRTLRALDLDALLARLVREAAGGGIPTDPTGAPGGEGGAALRGLGAGAPDPLARRLLEDEYRARLDALRREIEAEIRRRLVADRGAAALARSLRRPLPEDVDFLHASGEELVAMRKAMEPLTRKLAARLARKRRRGRRGPLDFRSTMRHSLSYGGVPVEPRFRNPRPSKPEIVVVADVSGSVAAFARFTLQLVHTISTQFSRVRSFVFIDGIDEVTEIFEHAATLAEAVRRVNAEADVVWVDGHSDYGHALTVFLERWGREITPRTSILLLGDARNNYHAPEAWVVRELRRRARRVYWLNPEPRAYWGSGDSIVAHYAPYCDATYECRNLRQLEAFVSRLA
jgi:uncharacterized protein with von Willebrand factor type A (vWA) domain